MLNEFIAYMLNIGLSGSILWDLVHNDHNFVNFELYLVKVVMYLLVFISDLNVIWLFNNELVFIQKKKVDPYRYKIG